MQRGGSPTAYDRNLATAFGTRAAALVAAGTTGVMVAVQDDAFTQVPLAEIADTIRTVPLDHPLLASALDVGTSFGVENDDVPAHTAAPLQ
jgi:6-phosphofructokinase 1